MWSQWSRDMMRGQVGDGGRLLGTLQLNWCIVHLQLSSNTDTDQRNYKFFNQMMARWHDDMMTWSLEEYLAYIIEINTVIFPVPRCAGRVPLHLLHPQPVSHLPGQILVTKHYTTSNIIHYILILFILNIVLSKMKNTNPISSGKYNAADTISGIKSRLRAEIYTKQISLWQSMTSTSFCRCDFFVWCF